MTGIRKQVLDSTQRNDANLVNRMAQENAKQQAFAILRESQLVQIAVSKHVARMVDGLYDMETGSVELFDLS